MIWRLLTIGETRPPEGVEEAAWNMALDEAIRDAVAANAAPPTLRLYLWQRPAVTLGRFQDAARSLDLAACAESGVSLARRMTGGRGILHGDDLTVSLAAPVEALGFEREAQPSVLALYQRTARGFLCAFERLGVGAVMGACARVQGREAVGNCFAIVSQADIVEARTGRKLLGAALHRREQGILQQVSIPLGTEERCQEIASLRRAVFREAVPFSGTSSTVAFSAQALQAAVIGGMEATLQIVLVPGAATEAELCRAAELAATRYAKIDRETTL